MCLLSYHAPGVPVDELELRNGLEVNDEGAGYALATEDGLLIRNRSLNGEAMLDRYLRERKAIGTHATHGVFHARLSTSTAVTLDNCHPFPVGGDEGALLFHNGSLYPVPSTEPRCDSRIFADDKLMIGGRLDDPVAFSAADDYISSTGSKIIVITDRSSYREPVYIFNRSQWIATPEGALHSNADFLGKGAGWDELEIDQGVLGRNLWRWRQTQPGQCDNCYLFGHSEVACEAPRSSAPNAWRNETARRAKVAALAKEEANG
jgi:hypothetical protein